MPKHQFSSGFASTAQTASTGISQFYTACTCGLAANGSVDDQNASFNELINMHEQAAIERFKQTLKVPTEGFLKRPVLMGVFSEDQSGEHVAEVTVAAGTKVDILEYESGLEPDDTPSHTVAVKGNSFIIGCVSNNDLRQ